MNLEELRNDCAIKQKKGLHFIIASVFIWMAISIVQLTSLPMLTKNLLVFCFTAPLMPLAFFISKIINVDFQNKDNPLTKLGVIFSFNQILYLLIAMWVYPTVPEKMLMIIAMIFGAHLLPYGWLYKSKSYTSFAVIIPFLALIIGLKFQPFVLAFVMIAIELIFSVCLIVENRRLY
ncbi:DUF7010 family protein [Sporosalibacterium faouarense]|uniref:DUF7010 family protein n=1 Tax=Sporosalibacterium faouarense TaxID=516123 RepID=UPI00141D722A|nr:hypothetical protein [Sporosalibacterium faouarense]MTI48090.1 hypothetical protein [Bacillota bacterium]